MPKSTHKKRNIKNSSGIRSLVQFFFGVAGFFFFLSIVWGSQSDIKFDYSQKDLLTPWESYKIQSDTPPPNTIDTSGPIKLRYPFKDSYTDRYSSGQDTNAMYLKDPKNVKVTIDYDPEYREYDINESIGNMFYRNPDYMTFDEFMDYSERQQLQSYWKQRTHEDMKTKMQGFNPKITINNEIFDKIFGGNTIDIKPQGSAELTFAYNRSHNENPNLPLANRTIGTFDFNEKIQMNVTAQIGEKMKMGVNYNTEATFDFENKMKLEYTGKEDEIIKKIEAGNVSLPLNGTLIQGSQTLFGLKMAMQFGRLTVTTLLSQQKGQSSTINVQGGAQTTNFEIKADQYEANKHYFLAQYFHDNFDKALENPPFIGSQVNITKIEVWITNRNGAVTNTRNIVAFQDLAEIHPYDTDFIHSGTSNYPDNTTSNDLYNHIITTYLDSIRNLNKVDYVLSTVPSMAGATDYEKVGYARKLAPNEFVFNKQLGYISLNQALNADEVVGVAYEYQILGSNKIYKVGELTTDGIPAPNALIVKLLKSENYNPTVPLWKLMMKNIYSLGAYQVSKTNFRLDVLYLNDATGTKINFIPEGVNFNGVPLLTVLNLDRLDQHNNQQPDGIFDFIEGVTINSANGRVIFPEAEPFGKYLRSKFTSTEQLIANKYVYQALYDSTKTSAMQLPEFDKFYLKGSFQSTNGSEISLNALNIPQGSVTVTAGGVKLTENVDFTVDYTLGKVKIINQGILASGAPIKVNLESNSLFNIQSKTLWGTRLDFKVNNDFTIGGTFLHLSERPLTQKVLVGDEPISNSIYGFDWNYKTDSRLITKLVDDIPFIHTKEPSSFHFMGEFAQFIPGYPKVIGNTGTAYIDDFEASSTPIDIKTVSQWHIASVPQGQPLLFPEGALSNNLAYGYNRALFSWYNIDPLFVLNNSLTPAYISGNTNLQSSHFVRQVLETEIFPSETPANGQPTTLSVMNVGFYPSERGPYNYVANDNVYAKGILNASGYLKNPETRWGGIMRAIQTTDFEASNIEYIEFWMMDPYVYGPQGVGSGDLYFNLGDISEDILKDGFKSYENGLPGDGSSLNMDTLSSVWGWVPAVQAVVNAFSNDPNARQYQDVGLDCLSDGQERYYFNPFLSQVSADFGTGSPAFQNAYNDPSTDDYHYYMGSDYDAAQLPILDRYKRFNGLEGNSSISSGTYPTSETNIPDAEDINMDNTMSTYENYYQYHVHISPSQINSSAVGKNYITDVVPATVTLANGTSSTVNWYQFKIPVRSPETTVGQIQDFNSIRFIRMFMKGFTDSIMLRFAYLQFVRDDWRKYNYSLLQPGEYIPNDNTGTEFNVSTINIYENGTRTPIPYVMPPGVAQEINIATTNLQKLNEQSLDIDVCGLQDGDSRAAYKNMSFDVRNYKRIQMFIHAEPMANQPIHDGDLDVFIRLGTDFTDNYYEYSVPLQFTPLQPTSDELKIWPDGNNMDILLEDLQKAKELRNTLGKPVTADFYTSDIDPEGRGSRTITVKGNPSLAGLKTVMIGVRNPKKDPSNPGDDGKSKCAEIWVDELRLTDFVENGGWAANMRAITKLADLGTVTLAASKKTAGFGTLDQSLNQVNKDDITTLDASASIELSKFLPPKTGLKIPMYVGYSHIIDKPLYDPNDPDILLQNSINDGTTPKIRDSISNVSLDLITMKSINFTNVRKTKPAGTGTKKAKPHIYDIENWSLTYAYTETDHTNYLIQDDNTKEYKGALAYNFTSTPKNIAPFTKMKFFQPKFFKLLKDFNFYYMPSTIGFRTDVDRLYEQTQLRNTVESSQDIPMPLFYNKNFVMDRIYDLKFDLTKSLKFDFHAINNSQVDEPAGAIDNQHKIDSVKQNFFGLGRTVHYHQTANFNYAVPINKIPLLDFVTLNAKYGADYDWLAGPLPISGIDGGAPINLGNTIQNANTKQLNGQLNMMTLYNKIPFLKKANSPDPVKKPVDKKPVKAAKDTTKGKKPIIKKKKEETAMPGVEKEILKFLMMLKTVSATYSETNGTMLPGFLPKPYMLGNNYNPAGGGGTAPGLPFVFGTQGNPISDPNWMDNPNDIRYKSVNNHWLSYDSLQTMPFTQTFTQNLTGRATIEPIKNFKIEVNVLRNFTQGYSANLTQAYPGGPVNSTNELQNGTFSISFLAINTAFVPDRSDYTSATFDNFQNYRKQISQRLAESNPNWATRSPNYLNGADSGYYRGYSGTSQEVLLPAFIAAYGGQNPGGVRINNPFLDIPMPNWRVTYDGLSKIKALADIFTSINLSSGYQCTYNVNAYNNDINYVARNGASLDTNAIGDFVSKYDLAQVSIAESFSPLIGIDATLKNSLQLRFSIKRSRNIGLDFVNSQITEVKSNEIVFGTGYKFKNFVFPFAFGGTKPKNDLVVKLDCSIRKDNTIIRQLADDINLPVAGVTVVTVKTTADYVINQRFNIQAFVSDVINTPYVSTTFPTSNLQIGLTIRFTLSQ